MNANEIKLTFIWELIVHNKYIAVKHDRENKGKKINKLGQLSRPLFRKMHALPGPGQFPGEVTRLVLQGGLKYPTLSHQIHTRHMVRALFPNSSLHLRRNISIHKKDQLAIN